jgi:hypothetical protein
VTPEQEAEAPRLAVIIGQGARQEVLRMARVLVSKKGPELLGATEFEVRDRAHAIGAAARGAALAGRKKGATTGRAGPARTAGSRRGPSSTGRRGS